MKILFINLPYMGHVIPTIGLVQELVRAGHQVTYLLPSGWEERLQNSGADFLGYENSPKLDIQIRNAFRKAEEVIEDHDLVLYEQFFFLGKHLAEKYRKKCARIFTAPATNQAIMADFLSHGGPMGIFRLPLISRLWTADAVKGLGITLQCRNWLDEIVDNPPACNLVYTLRDFQPMAADFPEDRFHFIGPSVYDRGERFPAFPRRVIYISLGTIVKGADRFYRACIEAFRDENVTVVLTVSKQYKLSRLGGIPENFIVRKYVPQTAVLEQADLFITHGGMNSVSEAMAAGVPMVVIPFVSDQPLNGKQVEKLGLGRVLTPKAVTAETLRERALSVMDDENICHRVARMKRTVATAPGNRGAVKILEDYMR